MDYRAGNDVFNGLSLFVFAGAELGDPGSGKPNFVGVQLVNWDFFDILGVQPFMGRAFSPDEDRTPDARPVVILSYALWNKQLGADPQILGKNIRLNGQTYSVVGIMPKDFHDAGIIGSPDVWSPMMMHDQLVVDVRKDWFNHRRNRLVFMVGRLKPGFTPERARVSMEAFGNQLAKQFPTDNSGRNVVMLPLSETNVPPQQHALFVLVGTLMMVIVGLVLLIACGNVANLLLARAMQRRRELAIRLSLGASRGRLIRQLLTESLMIGLTAAALGIICAYWARDLLWALLPGGRPDGLDFSLDGKVLLFTLGLSIVATMLFGLVPSLQASKPQQMASLRDRTDAPSGTGRWYGLRGILVMAQITFSLIALVGSAMFIHSLRNAQEVDPGFETKRELFMALNPGAAHYPQGRAEQYYRDAQDKVRALPMVAEAGICNTGPFQLNVSYATFPEGVDATDPRNAWQFPVFSVSPGFFSAAGIPLLRGRDVNDHDDAQSEHVVLVNQAVADHLWKGKDPIGKQFSFAAVPWKATVIGVVGTVKTQTLGEEPQALLYFSLKQTYYPAAFLYVRTKGDPNAALPSVRSAVQSLDASINVERIFTGSIVMDRQLTGPRFAAELLAGFGGLALLLAAVGTYGVMAYSVSQRTQEIGIRMALGAQRADVLKLILRNGMSMVLAGVVVGLAATVIFTRSINTLLYGIGSFDAISFVLAAAVLVAVALIACWLPARHAMRVDPIVALRYE
jgi:predicted permease